MSNPAFRYQTLNITCHYNSYYYYKIYINYLIEEQWLKVNIRIICAILNSL